MGKGKGLLFNCAGSDGETSAVTKGGAPVTQAELFDLIMGGCDLEPLSGLESEASLRRKLKVRLPLTRFSSDKIKKFAIFWTIKPRIHRKVVCPEASSH